MKHTVPANLTVRFWGARGSIPSPARSHAHYGGNTSCIELQYGEQLLILDGGSGLRALGQELLGRYPAGGMEVAILLSHTHWDHIQGLPFFAPAYDERNRVTLYVAAERADSVQRALDNQMDPMHFPVPLQQLRGLQPLQELPASGGQIGIVSVETIELNHPGGCTGFQLRFRNNTLAYLPDHEPYSAGAATDNAAQVAHNKLIQFLDRSDLLILDTQYTADEYAHRIGWGHGCLSDSVQLALDARVRHLVLFHHDPGHTDEQIDRMVADACVYAKGAPLKIEGAAEGQTLTYPAAPAPAATSVSSSAPSTQVNTHDNVVRPVTPGILNSPSTIYAP